MNELVFAEYKRYIGNARAALQSRDYPEAKKWALIASKFAPEYEESWLLLAALSKPAESIAYLERALSINPTSERAARGMQWALERLAQTPIKEDNTSPVPSIEDTRPIHRQAVSPVAPVVSSLPAASQPAAPATPQQPHPSIAAPAGVPVVKQPRASKKRTRHLLVIILAILLFIIGALIIWLAVPGLIATARSSAAPIPANVLIKPSLTPTLTPTNTPTPTSTFTPTATLTSTATNTPIPTDTPYPTDTEIPYPTDTTWQASLDGRWIDVNLSEQMLYAYDGDTLVDSFIVSTGTDSYPTVTGEYYIYVKYTSSDMAGPGYYLPDVPYTMYFYKGYGIHGTYWHDNFGTPMSHGCVNMRTSEAAWLFDFADVGTLVSVHY
mgnify:CR=1 FL=1